MAFESYGEFLESVPADLAAKVPVTAAQAEEVVRREWGQHVLEVRLVYHSSKDLDGVIHKPEKPVWAVSVSMADGIYISSANLVLTEMSKLRAPGDSRPITDEERDHAMAEAERQVAEIRASFTDEFHIDYVDAFSGKWLGAHEGARGRPVPSATAATR